MKQGRLANGWLAGGLALLTALLSLASVSPAIHDWLHHGVGDAESHADCQHPDTSEERDSVPSEGGHFCAVTSFQAGVAFEVPALACKTNPVVVDRLVETDLGQWARVFKRAYHSRAPPAA